MRELPEPKIEVKLPNMLDGDIEVIESFTRDQVLAIQKQAFDAGFDRGWDTAIAPLLERIAALDAKLAQAVKFLRQGKAQFAPNTTNSDVDMFLADTLSAAPAAPEQQEPKLDKPARVGNGTFGVGVSSRLVVEAAQRHHEYHLEQQALTLEQRAEQDRRAEAFKALVAQAPNAQQAEAQEPEFWAPPVHEREWHASHSTETVYRTPMAGWRPLFTRPQPAQLERLSEEEVREAIRAEGMMYTAPDLRVAKAIQSALAAKNGVNLK